MKKAQIGSSVDDWLREEGIYEETTSRAIKRVLARQLQAGVGEAGAEQVEAPDRDIDTLQRQAFARCLRIVAPARDERRR